MNGKEIKDANGNIILQEGYYKDHTNELVGSLKKESMFDDKNRLLE